MTDPVFLLSSERSGSNLMRVMMDSHPQFSAPHSPHLIKTFLPLLPHYGPLSDPERLSALATDMLRVIDVQLRPWPYLPTLEEVMARGEPASFAGLVKAIYGVAAEREGKPRSFIKDNGAIPCAAEVRLLFPDARFLYLVRDARDVALSWKKSPGHPGGVKDAARMWADEQNATLRFLSMGPAVHVLHYEDLVRQPQDQLVKVCRFLDIEFHETMLEFFKGREARTSADAAVGWKNLVKPVLSSNTGKYLTELARREQRAIERIAGQPLVQLGYPLLFPGLPRAKERNFWGKLLRAGRTAATQLLRGRAGYEELKLRTKRLKALRQIGVRAASESPVWSQVETKESEGGEASS